MDDIALAKWLHGEESTYARGIEVRQALLALLREGDNYIEMAAAADNSGGEYPSGCQECLGSNNHHTKECQLAAYQARLRAVLGGHESTPKICPDCGFPGEAHEHS